MSEQDQGVTPSGPGCQPSASAPPLRSGSSRSGIPNAARHVKQSVTVAEPHEDYTFSPGAGMLRLATHQGSRGAQWWSGDFIDYRGLVSIQMEDTYLRLDVVANGR